MISYKIQQLQTIIQALSQRQRDIHKEIQESSNIEYKNKLGNEHQSNSATLRIMYWVLWTLKGIPLKTKIKRDMWYLDWFHHPKGFHIYEFLAKLLNIDESIYKNIYRYGCELRYMPPASLHYYIYNWLFPEVSGGVFGMLDENSAENDSWRTTFKEQHKKECDEQWEYEQERTAKTN